MRTAPDAVVELAELATSYRAAHHLPQPTENYVAVTALPVDRRVELAEAYVATDPAAPMTSEALASYDALRSELADQRAWLEAAGYRFDVVTSDPYTTASGAPNSRAMRRDLREHRHLSALSTATTGSHPYLTDAENDTFRLVHDAFGHGATGRAFDADGEEAAYRHHRSMFTPAARAALTSETRVQNALNNLNGNAFIAQRAVLIPGAELDATSCTR